MSYLLLLLLPVIWLLWNVISLLSNYKLACQINVPIVISPVCTFNPIWILLHKRLEPILKTLPYGLGRFARVNYWGWSHYDKYSIHKELGDIFAFVTPGGKKELYLASAEAVDEVMSRRKDFVKPLEMHKPLEIFGPNVDTVDGQEWQRHRKITTTAFNERNSSLVWNEALRQATDMLRWWEWHSERGVNTLTEDTGTLALNVLTAAGFGVYNHFRTRKEPPKNVLTMTFQESLTIVLKNLILVALVPHNILSLSIFPWRFAKVGRAAKEFKRHMSDLLDKEKHPIFRGTNGADNLLSVLVQNSDDSWEAMQATSSPAGAQLPANFRDILTPNEVFGNLFVYSLAGHETTAATIAYAVFLLAAYPQWQKWIAKEIHYVLDDQRSNNALEYDRSFPQLKRCLAVMYETLRLYPQTTVVPKCTDNRAQDLVVNGCIHKVPPKTLVFPNTVALHTNPRYWGQDSLVFRPSRWIESPKSEESTSIFQTEVLRKPAPGTYLPWSEGARVCPGKKFSQVEFVAVMVSLFRANTVHAVPRDGESIHDAQRRILDVVEDSDMYISLKMRRPGSVFLRWVRMS